MKFYGCCAGLLLLLSGCDGRNEVLNEVTEVAATRNPSHGFLGLTFESIDSAPLVIAGCVPNSGAEAADIRVGDVLIRLSDHSQPTFDQLQLIVAELEPGDEVTAAVQRHGSQVPVRFSLISFDDVENAMRQHRNSNGEDDTAK